jgi:hypothetical protein
MSNDDFNPYAAPLSDLTPEIVDEGDSLWRDGKFLIVRKESVFPDRCVKCNAPALGWRLKRTLYWHHPAWYALLALFLTCSCAGPLIYVVAALIVRKKMIVQYGLCPEHARERRRALAVTVLLAVVGIGLMVVGIATARRTPFPIMPWTGLATLFVAIMFGFLAVPTLSPKRIDSLYAKLRGAGAPFLAELPEWDGR